MSLDVAGMEACTRCRLSVTRTRVVVGTGPLDARLMVIGEAPGRDEDLQGRPFVGRSGQLLFSLIEEELGLTREQCYVTNTVKCRPPDNRVPAPDELSACRPWLDSQMAEVAAAVTLVAGLTAAKAVLGATLPMGQIHGRPRHLGAGAVVATYHPAAALRTPSTVEVMRADLAVVRALLEGA
jgi:uracil-DNA glycosylase family 4